MEEWSLFNGRHASLSPLSICSIVQALTPRSPHLVIPLTTPFHQISPRCALGLSTPQAIASIACFPSKKSIHTAQHGPGGTVVVAQAFRRCPTWNQHFGSSAKNRQKWSNQKLSLAKPQFHDLCQMFWFLRKTLSGLPEKQQPRFFWLQTQWGEWSLLEAPSQKHVCMYIYILLHYITLHYITLYYITLQIMLYYILLYSIKFYCIILYYIALYYIILYYIILYYIILYYIILYYIMLYYTVLYYIILHYITLYYI